MIYKFISTSVVLIGLSQVSQATENRLPDAQSDSCLAIAYKKFLDQNADTIDKSGNHLSQPYNIISDASKIDPSRDDIIYFVVDENNIVQQLRCK